MIYSSNVDILDYSSSVVYILDTIQSFKYCVYTRGTVYINIRVN